MKSSVQYRSMQAGEEEEVCALVVRVFNEFVAHQYSKQGVQEFLKYVKPQCLSNRCQEDSFVLLATTQEKIVGMIELVRNNHISLFYTEGHFQRKGIGRKLLNKSLEICKRDATVLTTITVNSSPNAVNIYKKLGFSVVEPEKEKNGIRFVPMKLELTSNSDRLSS